MFCNQCYCTRRTLSNISASDLENIALWEVKRSNRVFKPNIFSQFEGSLIGIEKLRSYHIPEEWRERVAFSFSGEKNILLCKLLMALSPIWGFLQPTVQSYKHHVFSPLSSVIVQCNSLLNAFSIRILYSFPCAAWVHINNATVWRHVSK